MAAAEKTVSALIASQLPDFIKADHPKFQRFIELYYKWLEQNNPAGISNTAGNTIYHAMQIGDYRDIDDAPDEFVKYFKDELLPYFPQNTSLDTRKLLKSAREYYSKKGSEESLRWLFRALFNEEIEINYPKEQIFRASDGKWKKPRAFRITATETNKDVDVSLLKKSLIVGQTSGASCVIESANRTIDADSGREIIEIYISNIKRYFENGELIDINYTDADGTPEVFTEKIIGTLSNIRIDSNIQTDPQQKRRGLLYNIGDPVVITGGLAATAEAEDAIGIVSNTSAGSIEAVTIVFPGYGYIPYPPNTEITVLRGNGDNPLANACTDLRLAAINVSSNSQNSQQTFIEEIRYDKAVIEYVGDTVIGTANLAVFTLNNHNVLLNVTELNSSVNFTAGEEVWANGTNYFDALFTGRIATPSNSAGGVFGGGGAAATGGILIYDVANTGAIPTILTGTNLTSKNTGKTFTFNSMTTYLVPANADSQIAQCQDYAVINTGGVALVTVINGGYGFISEPDLLLESHYDTQISENYNYLTEKANKKTYWQTFKDLGQIAHVWISNGGSGYANGDTISFVGRGYGGNATINVDVSGAITNVTILDRGEGHTIRPTCQITTSGGSGAVLTAVLFGDGFEYTIDTNAIGRITDLSLTYRGYDYTSTPNVSLKVVDTIIEEIGEAESYTEQEYVYQGVDLASSTFRANVKSYNRTTGLFRLYNYSGSIDTTSPIISANGVTCNVNTSPLARVAAPSQYPASVIATGLPNPMYYGNGRAKANAQFANGLIEFNGFFLNSDGFPSADKVFQDDTIYHNFSYIIQSEKSIQQFEVPLKSITHPVGMEVISKSILKSGIGAVIELDTEVDIILPINTTSTITVSNAFANVVTGTNTAFDTMGYQANVGDLFIIVDDTHPLRTQSKIISAVNSDTDLEIIGDFIYVGQGKLSTENNNTTVVISGAINAVSDFIDTSDQIRMNVTNMRLQGTVNINGTTITGNTTGANTTYFVGNVVVGSEVTVNNEIRTVTVVTDNQTLTVNSAFAQAAINKYMNANSVLLKTVSTISGNNLTLNSAIFANTSNLVYQVVPDYTDYNYRIVTLTME